MSIRALSRRAALSAVAGLAFAPLAALAQPSIRFRSIQVDVGPLRANMGDPTAAWLQEALPGLLAQAFAPYLAPGDRNGAALIAQIGFLTLGPSSGGTGPLGSSQDTITGLLIVHGPRGSVAAETPLQAMSTYYPMAVDQPLRVESNHDRIVALAQNFARWAPSQIGL
jgi:hypothetical protein